MKTHSSAWAQPYHFTDRRTEAQEAWGALPGRMVVHVMQWQSRFRPQGSLAWLHRTGTTAQHFHSNLYVCSIALIKIETTEVFIHLLFIAWLLYQTGWVLLGGGTRLVLFTVLPQCWAWCLAHRVLNKCLLTEWIYEYINDKLIYNLGIEPEL